jgi:acetyltransferase-like isoleucine patch superfamily enzyme
MRPVKRTLKAILGTLLAVLPSPRTPEHAGPGLHVRWRMGWLKGVFCKSWIGLRSRLRGGSFQAGRHLSVQGRLRVRGPGHVVLGDDVIIDDNTDLYTNSRDACIRIGDRTFVNGARMSCVESITIGEDGIVADARMRDSDLHAIGKDRHEKGAYIAVAPIVVGRNVWIAAGVTVLKGVTIGDDSVIASGSIVTKAVPEGAIMAGNPAREIGRVPDVSGPSRSGPVAAS